MPRPHRIRQYEFPYSITTRCNNKEFYMEKEYAVRVFQEVFRKLKSQRDSNEKSSYKYDFQIHHLEIMSNHYHLVISVSARTPIDRIMQQINAMVARAMNKFLGRIGHFWCERYKSRILNSVEYLQRTIAYVYRNPLKARMTKNLLGNMRSTLGYYWNAALPEWIHPDPFLKGISPGCWKIALQDLVFKFGLETYLA